MIFEFLHQIKLLLIKLVVTFFIIVKKWFFIDKPILYYEKLVQSDMQIVDGGDLSFMYLIY